MPPVPVLYSDEHLLIVDKPSGVLVVPAAGRSGPTMVDVLKKQLGRPVTAVHRLDEETTGCLAFAFSEDARSARAYDMPFKVVIKVHLIKVLWWWFSVGICKNKLGY